MATHDVVRRSRRPREPVAPKIPAALADAKLPDNDLSDDGVYLSMRYGTLDLSAGRAEDVEFERCRFGETSLSATSLSRANFTDVEFTGCDLANLRLSDSRVFNVVVDRSRMTGTTMTDCGFRDVLFSGCRADLSSFRFGRFKNVVFRDCNLTEANFQGADLTGARFERSKLVGAQFSNAKMQGTRLSDCDLWGVAGIQSFQGAVVTAADAQSLVFALASAMGITIED
jgi:uncharacterized protein YjbI with pentapeptide repeats